MAVPLVALAVLLFSPHHLALALYPLCLKLLGALLYAHLRLLEFRGEPWVCAVLAALPFRTESTEVEGTQLFLLIVFECAVWP